MSWQFVYRFLEILICERRLCREVHVQMLVRFASDGTLRRLSYLAQASPCGERYNRRPSIGPLGVSVMAPTFFAHTFLRVEIQMSDFEDTAREVLSFLRRRLGFDLWMVTRADGDDWTVLHCEDHGYEIQPGRVLSWSDSFCSEMVNGAGPRIAPNAALVPCYAAAPISQQLAINSYIGVPLLLSDGSLFGTLCAIDPSPQPEKIREDQELIEMVGKVLSKILQMELRADEEASKAERFEAQALCDSMTGLYNRAGWDQLAECQDSRNRRYGNSAAVLIIDLDDLKLINDGEGHAAGDDTIKSAARALNQASRSDDIVARLGGDEFGIIGVNCDRAGGEALRERVCQSLQVLGVSASVGLSMANAANCISSATILADKLMYEHKRMKQITET
ncbi:sensor domain-containing diguanylate cyclase [Pseudomonas sp. HY13-MNA-CIBAN-0226]|uniref:sensor domain-containing diguanylate cyclase n=1 Tax=Pseudomonas sp. HY13-MNA-CIBAN-0226 TaxID=3140473 RepID=UPI00331B759E